MPRFPMQSEPCPLCMGGPFTTRRALGDHLIECVAMYYPTLLAVSEAADKARKALTVMARPWNDHCKAVAAAGGEKS